MYLMMRQERIRRGWTLGYVAKEVGVTKVAVQYFETSHCRPSYDVLVKLEDLFGMTHRALFAAAPEEPHNPPEL